MYVRRPSSIGRGRLVLRSRRGAAPRWRSVAALVLTTAVLAVIWSGPARATEVDPVVTQVSPGSGPVTGGSTITITGSGFTSPATVRIGDGSKPTRTDIAATSVDVVSSTEIIAVTGRGAKLGSFNVFVSTDGGHSGSSPGDAYSYVPLSTWGPLREIPAPDGGVFDAVSCTDATDCTAVGQSRSKASGEPIHASESAGTWGPATDIPAAGGLGFLFAVSCATVTDCTAVGADGDSQPIAVAESDGTWGPPVELPAPGGSGRLSGVSCASAGDCTAVGYDGDGQPFHVAESGGTWGTSVELPVAGGSGYFSAVSCAAATSCTAVGDDTSSSAAIYATESAGTWSATAQIPDGAGGAAFDGVSCTEATDCVAVGFDHAVEPIYAVEVKGSWGAPDQIPSPGGGGAFTAVSCTDPADCSAVGFDHDTQPIVATESLGAWGSIAEAGGSGELGGVSCTSAGGCTAVGYDGANRPTATAETTPPPPTISSVSPGSGPLTGGTPLTIIGSGFAPGALVEIGQGNGPGPTAADATAVDVVSPTEITATTGAGSVAGTRRVWVLTPGGAGSGGTSERFTYKG
jgi:hypothetical protein